MDKREAKREFKERKPEGGVFAVRFAGSGEVWVGSSANLPSSETGLRFMLRQGTHINRELQAAWNTHGQEGFRVEIVERFPDDLTELGRRDALRDRRKHWMETLGARAV
jgi:hypothetical protein